ncbi:MAG TPA: pyridoxamine 5'-phosphate oxidase family protein [Steroidobacteraceae bacterium]|nr:pyridoxamine 5'-phosphate oxidase family protein [Steroidobacteraceae bacterium]
MNAILDEALFCHVGFSVRGQPFVLPMVHARIAEQLYIHGSIASRLLKRVKSRVNVCVTATLLDGLVLARSAFHHSMNYRSVVILGKAHELTDEAEKRLALTALVEHVLAGRSEVVRGPSKKELRATSVLRLPITEASAKIRGGPPLDDEADYALSCWAGVLPLHLRAAAPVPDPQLPATTALPPTLAAWSRGRASP